jgi:hypothetical protein
MYNSFTAGFVGVGDGKGHEEAQRARLRTGSTRPRRPDVRVRAPPMSRRPEPDECVRVREWRG